jgi:uncharacterized protein (DUF2384 family)
MTVRLLQQELERLAADTFETKDDAVLWLRTPHPLLDGKPPFQVGQTDAGAQRVKSILIAIKYGGVV